MKTKSQKPTHKKWAINRFDPDDFDSLEEQEQFLRRHGIDYADLAKHESALITRDISYLKKDSREARILSNIREIFVYKSRRSLKEKCLYVFINIKPFFHRTTHYIFTADNKNCCQNLPLNQTIQKLYNLVITCLELLLFTFMGHLRHIPVLGAFARRMLSLIFRRFATRTLRDGDVKSIRILGGFFRHLSRQRPQDEALAKTATLLTKHPEEIILRRIGFKRPKP